jgi:hypothetical protein
MAKELDPQEMFVARASVMATGAPAVRTCDRTSSSLGRASTRLRGAGSNPRPATFGPVSHVAVARPFSVKGLI